MSYWELAKLIATALGISHFHHCHRFLALVVADQNKATATPPQGAITIMQPSAYAMG